jgi:nucleotide-binding universal stress UspA family protein
MPDLLLPFDNSPSALRALDHAVALAGGRPGTRVHLLGVLDEVGQDTRELIDAAEIERVLSAEASAMLDPARVRLEAAGVLTTVHALTGAPARVIADLAREQGVAQIVMGTRGLGPIPGLVLGSVASRVLQFAQCPVTLVK